MIGKLEWLLLLVTTTAMVLPAAAHLRDATTDVVIGSDGRDAYASTALVVRQRLRETSSDATNENDNDTDTDTENEPVAATDGASASSPWWMNLGKVLRSGGLGFVAGVFYGAVMQTVENFDFFDRIQLVQMVADRLGRDWSAIARGTARGEAWRAIFDTLEADIRDLGGVGITIAVVTAQTASEGFTKFRTAMQIGDAFQAGETLGRASVNTGLVGGIMRRPGARVRKPPSATASKTRSIPRMRRQLVFPAARPTREQLMKPHWGSFEVSERDLNIGARLPELARYERSVHEFRIAEYRRDVADDERLLHPSRSDLRKAYEHVDVERNRAWETMNENAARLVRAVRDIDIAEAASQMMKHDLGHRATPGAQAPPVPTELTWVQSHVRYHELTDDGWRLAEPNEQALEATRAVGWLFEAEKLDTRRTVLGNMNSGLEVWFHLPARTAGDRGYGVWYNPKQNRVHVIDTDPSVPYPLELGMPSKPLTVLPDLLRTSDSFYGFRQVMVEASRRLGLIPYGVP